MQMTGCLLVGGAVGLLLSASAYPHDDTHWIEQNPSYISGDGKHCCGPGDCMRFAKDCFLQDGDAIYFLPTTQKFTLKGPGVYQSQTDDWWACLPGANSARDWPTPPPPAILPQYQMIKSMVEKRCAVRSLYGHQTGVGQCRGWLAGRLSARASSQ